MCSQESIKPCELLDCPSPTLEETLDTTFVFLKRTLAT